ncbi:alpha/beta hydrolase [Modicisalibacter radicis]|uniref:alpha/beta hydrolase n=1 Tax=Halomonas sp. EAR18 TaxID=2518972 RepID=UPI00109D500F|nr:alpha/beta hydrolase [Halomonas sp. EAR18]
MALHPDIAAFLELVADSGNPPLHTLTPQQARTAYETSSQMLDEPPSPGATTLSVTCRDGHRLELRRYQGTDILSPTLLYFHGGGYTLGSLDSHDTLCRAIARESGCTVLAVAYRLAPEHKFPTAFHDAQDAYLWLLQHGTEIDVDITRIAVGGDSVGGTLATALCLAARDNGWPPPRCQVLLYPCTSAWQDSESHRRYAQGHLLEGDTLQWMFGHYLNSDADRLDWRFAPLEASDLTKLPPAFIALADHDPLIDEGVAYANRLQADGVDTQLTIYPGMIHDFARLGGIVPEAAQQARRDIAQALRQYLFNSCHA